MFHAKIQSRSLAYTLLFILISASFSGCFLPQNDSDDFEPPPPPAAVQFIHQDSERGPIEVRFNGSLVTQVQLGDVSPSVALEQGEGTFEFFALGAATPFFETELYTLESRVYTFAFVKDSISSDNFIDLNGPTQEPEESQHWLRFLNLSDVTSGQMFRGTEPMIEFPLDDNPSEFMMFESADSVSVGLSAENGAPIASGINIELPSGGSSLLIIGGSVADSSVTIKTVPLDIDRLSLVEPGAEVMTEE